MDVDTFLSDLRSNPAYRGQIVYVHELPPTPARYAEPHRVNPPTVEVLEKVGVGGLYSHQAEAIGLVGGGEDVLVATGTSSGKTLCYTVPIVERLREDPEATALLLFPTKALCQDQYGSFASLLEAAGVTDRLAGVYDGDTPSATRRKLRDRGSVIFSNPDMVHAALMPQHLRWARFLAGLRFLVLDELHVYSGIFGTNMSLFLRRFLRVCRHYGATPQVVSCSATIANPKDQAEQLTGRSFHLVDRDGSPTGKKTFVFWNPPRMRSGAWRSRRSANVEAHDLMAGLIERGIPTIIFSKAKMTAEMIHRYVSKRLEKTSPGLASKVAPYRAGYLPSDRREIEVRLFRGELLGVSTTAALELGIDVGALEACIIVGYPGKLASFFQQSGRAGRKERDSLVFLIGLDTTVNQYVMNHPDYVFDRPIEEAVIDPENPFVAMGHVRCAAHEIPLATEEVLAFGPHGGMVVRVLEENRKLKRLNGHYYHAASEVPQHEVSLRGYADGNVVIEDMDTGNLLGQVNQYDAEPILHPEAIYMHLGDTYRVCDLDLERNIARVKREDVDYYTQPQGGTDIHHIDQRLREKSFGTGTAYWGEVTAYFNTAGYEKIHFYSLDAISQHQVDLPTMVLETMALWIVPPEELMTRVREAGLDAYSGLRGIGYATRMILPLFMTCDTLDFSHTVGSANSPWHTVFIYERYDHGLGFTEKAYQHLGSILPRVYENVRACSSEDGCPCCVGKPLRQYTTWNVERGEASIPSKLAALMIFEGLLEDGSGLEQPDSEVCGDSDREAELRLEQALRRRLERPREPQVFHPIRPEAAVEIRYPAIEAEGSLGTPDSARRSELKRRPDRDLHKRIAERVRQVERDRAGDGSADSEGPGRSTSGDSARLPGRSGERDAREDEEKKSPGGIVSGDPIAARAKERLDRGQRGGKPG